MEENNEEVIDIVDKLDSKSEVEYIQYLTYDEETQQRDKISYSNKIKNTLKLLEIPFTEPIQLVGSYRFASQIFNDIDGRQIVQVCKNKNDASRQIASLLRHVAFKIKKDDNVYWSNLKAGIINDIPIKWKIDEVMRGFKFINGKIFKLKLALQQNSKVNIEVWSFIDGRFIEISNFLVLEYCDENGQVHSLNKEPGDFESNVKQDIRDNLETNVYKALKRAFILAQHRGDKKILLTIQEILLEAPSTVYQIATDINIIIEMLKNLDYPPLRQILNTLDTLKNKLGSSLFLIIDKKENIKIIYELLNNIINNKLDKKVIIEILNNIYKNLLNIINKDANEFIEEKDLITIFKENNYI